MLFYILLESQSRGVGGWRRASKQYLILKPQWSNAYKEAASGRFGDFFFSHWKRISDQKVKHLRCLLVQISVYYDLNICSLTQSAATVSLMWISFAYLIRLDGKNVQVSEGKKGDHYDVMLHFIHTKWSLWAPQRTEIYYDDI